MLAPDVRTVAVDLLRPPTGFRLDHAVLTTYSLDLETLLALPLAVLAQSDQGLEALLSDPLLLVESLREAGGRLHVFVDEGAMAVPRAHRDLYALLEPSVHPVAAPSGGAFHPKVWVARFTDDAGAVRLRVAVLSRNLTFDRSWDLALATEAAPAGKQRAKPSAPLAELLEALPGLTDEALPEDVTAVLATLTDELHRTRFPSPEDFTGEVTFHCFGLGRPSALWKPRPNGSAVLAIAPFVGAAPLNFLASLAPQASTLVARQDQLDALPTDPRETWSSVRVLADAATESDDDTADRPSGLHAKAIAIEHGYNVTWWVGSANLSHAAWHGANVEVMASLTASKGRALQGGGFSGQGIRAFLDSGFDALCHDYQRAPVPQDPPGLTASKLALRDARRALVDADLRVRCTNTDDGWTWVLEGDLTLPDGVTAHMWPVSRREAEATELVLPFATTLPMASLTCFVAFRISAPGTGLPDERLTRKLPANGLPDGRVNEVLRSLISTPERLLRFLRALLGGLEGLLDLDGGGTGDCDGGRWAEGLGGETLLEDLVRAASRDPKRLAHIKRILDDLQQTDEGRAIIPPGLLETWLAVEAAITEEPA